MIFGKKIFFRFLWEKIRIFNFFQKSWIFFSNFFSILGKKNWKFREKIENRDFLSQKSKKNFFSKNHFFRFPRWFFSPEDFFLVLPQPSEKSKIHVYFYPIPSPVVNFVTPGLQSWIFFSLGKNGGLPCVHMNYLLWGFGRPMGCSKPLED